MDDEQIIRLYQDRDPEAINQTKQKYGSLCHSIAHRLLQNHEDAEECVSDTYFALWEAIPPATPSPLSAFVAKITRNLAMKRLEHLSAAKRKTEAMLSFEELSTCLPASDDLTQQVRSQAFRESITHFLEVQDADSRRIFLRRYFFFDSVKEIALRYEISQSKVKSRLMRTREKLKTYLIQEGFYEEQ